ncbi:hypothetical protein PFICI_11076 [Pestalotiopsis fici W106-1]|uniref:Mmc1 C-terminal domain-containing protein n=1 Tax=Pestalotiopsis fici (strain W106-1 / CGMCC3.15140) TaxID=1229662 RepID=W3WVP9_PESFW|nr:uncharacterized protein PFICI_11076 [Pestalotiopsis fici W106-1]ETS77202.1 hypothetical protein PFICI_11076 [Pestalotiopsis fici W106-1]
MPPRLSLRASAAPRRLLGQVSGSERQAVCFFCSLTDSSSPRPQQQQQTPATRRARRRRGGRLAASSQQQQRVYQSTTSTASSTSSTTREPDARKELEDALVQLQKHAASFVNLSRLQLAINGLRQEPGSEAIRVAILGLTNGTVSGQSAKQVLKLLLADPLKDEEEWEREVDRHDLTQPMIIRVGAKDHQTPGTISLAKGSLLHEVNVSSATMNGHNLELLLMETNPYVASADDSVEGLEDAILVPTVDIPISGTGRYTPVTTPVHKALLVTNGLMGAASVASLPLSESADVIAAAVDIPEYKPDSQTALPFTPIDVGTASVGLGLIRKSLNDAMEYEHMWFQSNLPKLKDWVKADVTTDAAGITKAPVRRLIASLLQNTTIAIAEEEARAVSTTLTTATSPKSTHLNSNLAAWAEGAHSELQEQLDLAFSSRRWRKLGWWKLFWRVDDVHMLTTDIINQRFLPTAEKKAIYLAGQIQEANAPNSISVVYDAPVLQTPDVQPAVPTTWPTNIPAARSYLQNETIPALQALAQKLVLQTLSTSGLTTSLGALAYFGTLTTGIYEAGAVAALGIVWSMRRMQKQWETARSFWEGEVREEGRKAVRGVETSVEKVLKQSEDVDATPVAENEELIRARDLVEKATEALDRLK